MNAKSAKGKNHKLIIVGGLVIIAVIVVLTMLSGGAPASSVAKLEEAENGELVIHKEDVTKTASFYSYESNGTYMEVIAVRANDGSVRTAFNTCQVCYNSGRGYYEQLGDELICNNCGNRFTIDQIELIKGGCNPVPILSGMKAEDDTQIVIFKDSLVEYEPLFISWKQ